MAIIEGYVHDVSNQPLSGIPIQAFQDRQLIGDPSIHQHANKSMVSWTNDDLIQHTVTSDEEGLFASGPISPGMI
jgi:hypothetical protein